MCQITIFVLMKIAITGTRGIPNRYGGFEQFAEQLSTRLARRGHYVWVYNPSFHPFTGNEFMEVKIIRKPSPEKFIGPAANYIYDFICLRDAIIRKADMVLECGYATAAPALRLLNFRTTKVLINPDGMEWQRSKFNPVVRRIIRIAEQNVAKSGYSFVCDSPELIKYYNVKYNIDSVYIPYGAEIFSNPDEKKISAYNIKPFEYFLVIARFEPENNLRNIILGFKNFINGSNQIYDIKLLIVGNPLNRFGKKLLREFKGSSHIVFTKDIFDHEILDNLRFFSKAYFHGHSAGGTNPSLLEAMAAGSFVIAHDNIFNRYILKDNALYFKNETDITDILRTEDKWITSKDSFVKANLNLIEKDYSWEDVTERYDNLFKSVL